MGYKVQKGDGWYKIAKNTGMDVNELLKLNNATLNTVIHPGQEIKTKVQNNQSGLGKYVQGFAKEETSKTMPTPYKPEYTEQQFIRDNARSIQQQLVKAGYDLGKYGENKDGVDGKWGKTSQAALDKALSEGYRLDRGKLINSKKDNVKPTDVTSNPFIPAGYQAGAVRHLQGQVTKSEPKKESNFLESMGSVPLGSYGAYRDLPSETQNGPKNTINPSRRPNKVLSSKPAVINGETIDACAKYGNCKLSQQGYISNGHAWTRHNNQRTIYSGYNTKNRPTAYNEDSVVKYNSDAADNVVRDFDFNTLDKNSVYTVGMYYKGSPAQERAYNEGVDGVTNTHTGNLFWSPEADSWVVEHNIHGTAITNELRDVLGSRGKYGVTGIYQPYKNTIIGNAGAFIRGINK